MKRGDVVSWRSGRAGFGAWHRIASLEPLATVCGQVIPDRALVNIAERRSERPVDSCAKCLPASTEPKTEVIDLMDALRTALRKDKTSPVADRDPAPYPTIGAGA